MKLIILGSGGSVSIPRPFCNCKNCEKARREGIPYSRTGSSLFIPQEKILFDTPEEIRLQFEREEISALKHVFYTHWHQDHTQGARIFEHMNFSYPKEEKQKEATNVYIPENSYQDFEKNCILLSFYEKRGYIKIKKVKDRKAIKIGKIKITPLDFRRKDRVRYGYLIEEKNVKRIVYAPCSTFNLFLDENYENLDMLIMEIGWFGDTEKTRKKLPKRHPWQDHISFEENLDIIKKIKPKKTILTHVDGTRHLKEDANYDFLLSQSKKYKNLNVEIAYDGMKIKV